jgi:hypothetical protein
MLKRVGYSAVVVKRFLWESTIQISSGICVDVDPRSLALLAFWHRGHWPERQETERISGEIQMRSHWLLLVCLLFAAIPAIAQDAPRAFSGELDELTGQVTLNWLVPNGESDWLEGFDDGVADGFTYDNPANWSVGGGFLTGVNTPFTSGSIWTSGSYGTQSFGDGITEASCSRTAGSDAFTQLLTVHGTGPFSDTYSGYFFGIAPTAAAGYIYVARIDAGAFTTFNAWGSAPMNLGLGAVNTIAVVSDAGTYTMFVNGVEVFAFYDTTYPTGQVGCGFSEDDFSEITGSVAFDYFSADDNVVAMTSLHATPYSIQGTLEDGSHVPPSFNARRRPHKTEPHGLIYVDGEYQGMQIDELDAFIEFNVYMNGALLAATTNTNYSTTLTEFGNYSFELTALYDEGESLAVGPVNLVWTDPLLMALSENFDVGLPETWTVESSIATASWKHSSLDLTGKNLFATPYMIADSDVDGYYPWMQTRLISPAVDITNSSFTQLSYSVNYNNIGSDYAEVDWSADGGASWNNIVQYIADTIGDESFDVTAATSTYDTAWFSWYYDDTDIWAWYMSIDDVEVYVEVGQDPVTLSLTPHVTTIPQAGGTLIYDVNVLNIGPSAMNGLQYRTFATLPNLQVFGPLVTIPWNLTPFMDATVLGMTQDIPSNAPAGEYLFTARAGVSGNPNLQIEDSFIFTKLGVATDEVMEFDPEDWKASGSFDIAGEGASQEIPVEFALSQAYPNPFNPTTTVAVSLPIASELSVAVFNVMGQKVATLANGKLNAGTHNFVFDASDLSSGLYFIQAVSGSGELNDIQKITLMK